MPIDAIATQVATLAMVGSGICLMLSSIFPPFRAFAGKLFVAGCTLAVGAAVISTHIG